MISKLIRQSLKPIKRASSEKAYQTWLRLFDDLSSEKINFPVQLNALNITFTIHHAQAFLNQFESIFVDEIYKFNCTAEKPVIIDCGSNMGTSVLYFKQLYPKARVYAFEPDHNIFKILETNININQLEDIEAVNKAVWINHQDQFFTNSDAQSGSLMSGGSALKVSCIRLNDFMMEFDKINFLKLDIEGAEVNVLNDISDQLHKVDFVFVEYHSYLNRAQDLSKLLATFEKQGFRYVLGGNHSKSPFVRNITEENMDLTIDIFASKI